MCVVDSLHILIVATCIAMLGLSSSSLEFLFGLVISMGDLAMARVRVMYWKEIPVQVQAEDEDNRVTRQLDERFQKAVDAVAMIDGSQGTDEYLEGWQFGPYFDQDGPAADSAESVARKLEKMPENFVRRILELQKSGKRDVQPGSIDRWADI